MFTHPSKKAIFGRSAVEHFAACAVTCLGLPAQVAGPPPDTRGILEVRDVVVVPGHVLGEWERPPRHVFDGYTCPEESVIVMPDLVVEAVMGVHGRMMAVMDEYALRVMDGLAVAMRSQPSEGAPVSEPMLQVLLILDEAMARERREQGRSEDYSALLATANDKSGDVGEGGSIGYALPSRSTLASCVNALRAVVDGLALEDRQKLVDRMSALVGSNAALKQDVATLAELGKVLVGSGDRSIAGGDGDTVANDVLALLCGWDTGMSVPLSSAGGTLRVREDAWLRGMRDGSGEFHGSWVHALCGLGDVNAATPRVFRSAPWLALADNARLASVVLLVGRRGSVVNTNFRMASSMGSAEYLVAPEVVFFDRAADWLESVYARIRPHIKADGELLRDAEGVIANCRLLAAVARKQWTGIMLTKQENVALRGVGIGMARGVGYHEDSWMFPRDDHATSLVLTHGVRAMSCRIGVVQPEVVYMNIPRDGANVVCRGVILAYRRPMVEGGRETTDIDGMLPTVKMLRAK